MLQLKIENFLFFLLQYLKGTIDSISSSVLYFESLSIQKLSFCGWRFVTTYISSYSFRYKHCFRPFDLWRVIMISHQRETFMTRYWHKLYFGAMSLQKKKSESNHRSIYLLFWKTSKIHTQTQETFAIAYSVMTHSVCKRVLKSYLVLANWSFQNTVWPSIWEIKSNLPR